MPTTERRGFTDIETARLLGVSVATVRRWRLEPGRGPIYRKLGTAKHSSVRYFTEDIEAFIASAKTGGGTQTEAA